jgi:nucleotide-binding universal stress UspA family protein
MYRTIIWATDGSREADLALEDAVELAQAAGGRIIAVHCDQQLSGRAAGWPVLPDEDDRRVKIRSQVEELHDQGIDVELVVRRTHHDAPVAVADIARELEGDLIVCGTRGALLGSFARRLLHVAPCPVLTVPERVASRRAALPVG